MIVFVTWPGSCVGEKDDKANHICENDHIVAVNYCVIKGKEITSKLFNC